MRTTSHGREALSALQTLLVVCLFSVFGCGAAENQTRGPLTPSLAADAKRLVNPRVGYSLRYPQDWQVRGQVTATEFARSAQCESVEVIDFQPPPGSGPSAVIQHSFVQLCAKPLTDAATIENFMRQTYGEAFAADFQSTDLNGVRAYQARREAGSATIFLQTKGYRIQIFTAVVADAAKRSMRGAEVEAILKTFSIV
jgi:hypothetical protein